VFEVDASVAWIKRGSCDHFCQGLAMFSAGMLQAGTRAPAQGTRGREGRPSRRDRLCSWREIIGFLHKSPCRRLNAQGTLITKRSQGSPGTVVAPCGFQNPRGHGPGELGKLQCPDFTASRRR